MNNEENDGWKDAFNHLEEEEKKNAANAKFLFRLFFWGFVVLLIICYFFK
jgi:hypothetical protein